jgi:hypothetical protein
MSLLVLQLPNFLLAQLQLVERKVLWVSMLLALSLLAPPDASKMFPYPTATFFRP